MKDSNGNVLHIGELVTCIESARPKWLIGRQGIVEALGEVRIKLRFNTTNRIIAKESIRIDPAMLIVGEHHIVDPVLHNPLIVRALKTELEGYLALALQQAVEQKIISQQQSYKLKDFLVSG